jgi:hypothetical protein
MRWSGFFFLSAMGGLYALLARTADGLLAGFGYAFAALLFVLAVMNLVRPSK